MSKLNPTTVRRAKAGKYPDGNGLSLTVKESGVHVWLFRYTFNGKRREMGLTRSDKGREIMQRDGDVTLSLAQAREAANHYRSLVARKIDPLAHKEAAVDKKQLTFAEVVEAYIAEREAAGNIVERTLAQTRRYLRTYAVPVIGHIPLMDVKPSDVIAVLLKDELWTRANETADRTRGAIAQVFKRFASDPDAGTVYNPAALTDPFKNALPEKPKAAREQHHAALSHDDLPALMAELETKTSISALALRFTILSAVRTSEALEADWSEFDLDQGVWTIPADRMKVKTQGDHRVPLSPAMLSVLEALPSYSTQRGWLFPTPNKRKRGAETMSENAMATLLKKVSAQLDLPKSTVHGMRSTFASWSASVARAEMSVYEKALHHKVGDAVHNAYQRDDLLTARIQLMRQWGNFATGKPWQEATAPTNSVVPIRGTA